MKELPIEIALDDVIFPLKKQHDFTWLQSLGRVFRVFDRQDSGNISFGVQADGVKRFVKYAGAETVRSNYDPQAAVANLRQAMPLYEKLRHRRLVRLLDYFEAGEQGYAAVFEWFEGENLGRNQPGSPFILFRQLPVKERLAALDCIFEFHAHVEACGFVAVDFYDGSILYDFATKSTKICDIDLYRQPFVNTVGRLWGSSRFMAPEEFEMGAVIDRRTNVYNMGAAAFEFVGGGRDRSLDIWEAADELYHVAVRAVEPDREKRYPSVAEFFSAWRQAQS
ncbi:serine/threonine protein kinase [Paenibacillus hamazuiensis]|uniref:serine/threonine protein kinase n=1 Tax=Paenibacillus hamazuiensis TaxID=2936508 RepID=UPI00200C0158|nr:serine/threonine protein kinase [Paenibacillus hamazuiensis]